MSNFHTEEDYNYNMQYQSSNWEQLVNMWDAGMYSGTCTAPPYRSLPHPPFNPLEAPPTFPSSFVADPGATHNTGLPINVYNNQEDAYNYDYKASDFYRQENGGKVENDLSQLLSPEQLAESAIDAPGYDAMTFFITLPKEIFPPATTVDSYTNEIIDEFCKVDSIKKHAPWILDVEFGMPRLATNRLLAIYDIKLNSVQCRDVPNVVHPDFENCDKDLKRIILSYYREVVSMWYKGYVLMNYDNSVENFHSWLSLPMQEVGMCWCCCMYE